MPNIPLQKKTGMPLIGLGTWKLNGKECEQVLHTALELGYRHIDTADTYQNHLAIGQVIKSCPQREQLFLTTKLSIDSLLPHQVEAAVPRFLEDLHVNYLDLLLIHWPNPNVSLDQTLLAMQAFQKQGIVRKIGVSNFVRSHFECLASYRFPIAVNQIEMHPYLQRRPLVHYCRQHEISLTAYRPLAKGAFEQNEILKAIGAKYKKTASQVALNWLVQQDIVVIPKAASAKHLKDNLALFDFELSAEDRQQIAQLESGRRFCNPADLPVCEDE
ncbi:aldo/keto reductase [Candidatus Protochlamydia phocaeensis]|uniref:aldo/keto reductase n=1 Tax=Candidatus Protochlamydia phocaeensis TaxID=1414722 RepID=UPI00083877A7|nr:aldo/keto reductase [Candidatus Protochlamydia phocaeensis]